MTIASLVALRLGEITFSNFEIPERINFGGSQALTVHQLVGGKRVINSMGRVDDDITWSGLFFGSTALFRARFLDTQRANGDETLLTYSGFTYRVIIESFKANFERFYQIPYTINCKVIEDLTKPVDFVAPIGINDAISNDFNMARDIVELLKNGSISDAFSAVNGLIGGIGAIDALGNQQIADLAQSLSDTNTLVNSSIAGLSGSIF